jgi:flagellin-like hook-associated protein FlgL
MSKTLNERVAVLETKLDHVLKAVDKLVANQGAQQKLIESLNSRWGFAMLVVSSIGATILAFKDWILIKLGFSNNG